MIDLVPFFTRNRWPKHLERRLSQNAETRKQIDAHHKDFVAARAEFAQQTTDENASRIEQVQAAVRSLSSRFEDS